jgi:hypothetical protein
LPANDSQVNELQTAGGRMVLVNFRDDVIQQVPSTSQQIPIAIENPPAYDQLQKH